MSACMLTAVIAVPADRADEPDYEKGRRVLEQVQDPRDFSFGDPVAEIDALLPDLAPGIEVADADFVPLLDYARQAGQAIIDNLEEALGDSQEYDVITVAGYKLYLSGGLSWGEAPTDAAEAIWDAHKLPEPVLLAMGFIPDCTRPLEVP